MLDNLDSRERTSCAQDLMNNITNKGSNLVFERSETPCKLEMNIIEKESNEQHLRADIASFYTFQ